MWKYGVWKIWKQLIHNWLMPYFIWFRNVNVGVKNCVPKKS